MTTFKSNTIRAFLLTALATFTVVPVVHSGTTPKFNDIHEIQYHLDENGEQHKLIRPIVPQQQGREEDGDEGRQDGEIIGGFTQTTALPWHVRQLSCNSGGTSCASCGATLVKSDIVMTAAHCVVDNNSVTVAVVGALNVDFSAGTNDGTTMTIVGGSLSIHPNYNTANIGAGYDIAMYKVSPVTNQVVTVNSNTGAPSNGQSVYIFGHGLTSNGGSSSNALMGLQTNAVVSCPSSASDVPDQHVCVLRGSGFGACSGDSGGPCTDETVTSNVNGATQYGLASYVIGPSGSPCASGNPDVYIDTSFFTDWIDSYICSNSADAPSGCTPTATTTPAPTQAAPTQAPTCASCFSESATVQVLDGDERGRFSGPFNHPKPKPLAMKDLEVGHQIFAGLGEDNKPVYETVYGFAHRDVDSVTDYLHITTTCDDDDINNNDDDGNESGSECNSDLDISSNHLIFIQGKKDPVPAGSLVVGDVLIHQSTVQGVTRPARITQIEIIQKRGLYAPLTHDGTLIVDGIHASSYVSTRHLYPKLIDTITNFVSEHHLFHWWMAPYRIFCTYVSPRMCEDDYSEKEGYIWWLVIGRNLEEVFQGFSNLVIAVGLGMLMCVCGAFVVLENLLENPFFWLVQIACACCFWWKFSSSNPKKDQNFEDCGTKKQA